MDAKYILPLLAVAFLVLALWRLSRDGFKLGPASRTWLIIAASFGAVSAWLWWTGTGASAAIS
jgi:hypothetical protein